MATLFMLTGIGKTVNSVKNKLMKPFKMFGIDKLVKNNMKGSKILNDKISTRLEDLSVQTSAYNKVIPLVYGKIRIAGNIIWATDIIESINEYTEQYKIGGKFGRTTQQTTIEYTYYANLAVAICRGEIDAIVNIWADTELININSMSHTIYNGTEDQKPDPYIESFTGVGTTPAYRGIAYIVFKRISLGEYGNRVPNFTFEVVRSTKEVEGSDDNIGSIVKSIIIIPGSGEFVYDTVIQSKNLGQIVDRKWISSGKLEQINNNNNSEKADAVIALDQLQSDFSNLEWASPVVAWYASSLDIEDCYIVPRVEYKYDTTNEAILTEPDEWRVSRWERSNAFPCTFDGNEMRYGGTVNDASLLRFIKEIKSRGMKVMFYPMIFVNEYNKPWRGRMTGTVDKVHNFFNRIDGYNDFILHYARLLKNSVDAFVIGSEMIGLTAITDGNGNFPAVDEFISLAIQVKTIVGSGVKVTYAADWSEYHHTNNGWYNLDPLWASNAIDMIGIDAYFPLTEEKQISITKKDVVDGWTAGEGYDFYYANGKGTEKIPLDKQFAWKNMDWWWSNVHINPDEKQTDWIPQSKKIWFTEYGFPSVDCASNQPNVFYDPKSSESGFPYMSKGHVDFYAQRIAIQATEEKWENSSMIERMFLWTWDARPYPYYPDNTKLWSDGYAWKCGHWVNGKVGITMIPLLIRQIFRDYGLSTDLLGTINVYRSIDGMVVNTDASIAELMAAIQQMVPMDCVEDDDKICFLSRIKAPVHRIVESELLRNDSGDLIVAEIPDCCEVPNSVTVGFLDRDRDYESGSVYRIRNGLEHGKSDVVNLPIVMSLQNAEDVADRYLRAGQLERIVYSFELHLDYIWLTTSDVIELDYHGNIYTLRIINTDIGKNRIKIVACGHDVCLSAIGHDNLDPGKNQLPVKVGKTFLLSYELPAIGDNTNNAAVGLSVYGEKDGWRGSYIYNSYSDEDSFKYVGSSFTESKVGVLVNDISIANPYFVDYQNSMVVSFGDYNNSVEFESMSDRMFMSEVNMLFVGLELLQFEKVEVMSGSVYKFSGLIRAMYGTHLSNHLSGSKVSILDKFIVRHKLDSVFIGMDSIYRTLTFGGKDDNFSDYNCHVSGLALKPMAPVHANVTKLDNGDLMVSWLRRARGYHGWKDGVDVPVVESFERYDIDVCRKSGAVVASYKVRDDSKFVYDASAIGINFTSGEVIYFSIYQLSDAVGRGYKCDVSYIVA